jgi:sulfite exporter TauE/SafE
VPLSALIGRCLAYAILGAIAAASSGAVAQWGRQIAFFQPVWILLQAAAVILGGFLCVMGRVPGPLDAMGLGLYKQFRARWKSRAAMRGHVAAKGLQLLAGMAWAVLPCGLLYAAVMVAALASTAWGGALVMFAFALPGTFGIWAAPAVLRRLTRRGNQRSDDNAVLQGNVSVHEAVVPVVWMTSPRHAGTVNAHGAHAQPGMQWQWSSTWAVRLAGLMLMVMGVWALYHQVVAQWRAWCA